VSKADKAPPLAIPASMLIPDDEKLPSSMKTPESKALSPPSPIASFI